MLVNQVLIEHQCHLVYLTIIYRPHRQTTEWDPHTSSSTRDRSLHLDSPHLQKSYTYGGAERYGNTGSSNALDGKLSILESECGLEQSATAGETVFSRALVQANIPRSKNHVYMGPDLIWVEVRENGLEERKRATDQKFGRLAILLRERVEQELKKKKLG